MNAIKHSEERLMKVLLAPVISEKATMVAEKNEQVVFLVMPDATKPEIKAAIEDLFQVKVVKINTALPPRKQRRVGKFIGYKPQYKRAIVTVAPGDEEKIRQVLFPEV